MDDSESEGGGVLSILQGRKGWDEELSSISEFKQELQEADLAQEEFKYGWVLWRENERQQQILTLLQNIASEYLFMGHYYNYLMQFWRVAKVEGRNHYLSASNYPFCVGRYLKRGHCWYRKLCRDHVYVVDMDDDDQEQLQLIGGVGRAYRNKEPESSPDLRLYSTNEFPMRDEAARCGFISYLALPLFHSISDTNQCYAVLELLSESTTFKKTTLSRLDTALQIAGLRSTHNPILSSSASLKQVQRRQQFDSSGIREIVELAMLRVPRLYLAQVWVPCHHCIINTNLCYMQIASFNTREIHDDDETTWDYLEACKLHNLQIDVSSSFNSNLCDVSTSISKSPLAHYAQRARINMSHSFAISLQSLHNSNHLYVIQFFLLQPKFREDHACGLLLRIMKMNLKTFKFESGEKLVSESQKPNAIACESIDSLEVMKSYKQELSESDFTKYLNKVDSCCLRLSPNPKDISQGWVFGINSNSLRVPAVVIKEKIENFMNNIQFDYTNEYWIIQFWARKMVEDRCCLEALDQPYVVGCLSKGLASFRKKCMTHSYFVDDQAKEEELGPPGRVYRSGHPEISPDLCHYTTKEYPIRNYAMHCCTTHTRRYLALPIFDDEHNHKCVGVLELVGFSHFDLECIGKALKEAELCSTHTALYSRFLADDQNSRVIIDSCKEALTEEDRNALELICNIPQLYMANVWVHNGECVTSINSDMICMELTSQLGKFRPAYQVQRIHVQSRKGMIGMVLASENKSCFCRNLCEFSIVDQPLSHFEMDKRCEACFAICLQSSHTGDLVYVVEFFLYQGPATYEYVRSFLNFLLPMMKHELKSFKMASGKDLGEELVVEVIEFSDANKVDYSSVSEEADVFPIKFKSVQYSQKEHQHNEEQQTEESRAAAASDSKRRTRGKRKTQECSVAASNPKTGAKGKSKPRRHLTLEDLQPLFHVEKLKDVRKMLNVSKATLWRARDKRGLKPWPGKLKKNPLPRDSQPSTSSNNIQPLDTNTESTHHVINVEEEEEAEKVIIKVKYEEYIIKFELCLSLGVSNLFEQVATELNLKMGTFKLNYRDEDNDEISLTWSSDLHLCPKSQTATGRTCIQFFVQLISK